MEKESESGKECEWYKLQTNTLSVETRVCVKVLHRFCVIYKLLYRIVTENDVTEKLA